MRALQLPKVMAVFKKICFNLRHFLSQPYPVRSLAAYLLIKIGLIHWITYSRHGSRIQFRSAGLARLLWEDPDHLLDGEILIPHLLRSGGVFVDVGANIGILSLQAARLVGTSGKVFAIEAHPGTFDALRVNLRMNWVTNVDAVNCAVGDRDGYIVMSDRADDDWNKVTESGEGVRVEVRCLDRILKECDVIDILKVDVEGYELPVLRGAGEVLNRTRCVLLECWDEHTSHFGYTPRDLLAFMLGLNFHGFVLDEVKDKPALRSLNLENPTGCLQNWVFVKDIELLKSVITDDFLTALGSMPPVQKS